MDTIRLQLLFDNYVEKFDSFNNAEHRETYKWSAASYFQKYWDPEAEDFGEMFKTAFEDSMPQIDTPSFQPIGGVIFLCKQGPKMQEAVRAAFQKLLANDKSDIKKRQKRVEQFVATINKLLQDVAPDKWKYHQEISSALLFLSYADPDDNYQYSESEVKAFAEYLGVQEQLYKKDNLNLVEYYKLCDIVAAELQQQGDLLQLVDEALAAEADATEDSSVTEVDGENHILVYDLIYCAENYNLFEDTLFSIEKKKGKDAAEEKDPEEKKVKARIRALTKQKEQAEEERDTLQFPSLKGKTVEHGVFGKGRVTAQEEKYLTVSFGKKNAKKFLLPDAFTKGFLTISSEEITAAFQKIAELDENILGAQREIELLHIQLNGYTKS